MKRKILASFLTLVGTIALFVIMLSGAAIVKADFIAVTDTTIADFNQGTLYHGQLEPVDDGSVSLQSIGLAGGWNDTSTQGLPARFFHVSAQVRGYVYACGGETGDGNARSDCWFTSINPASHQLGAWASTTSLPQGLIGAAAVTATVGSSNYIYVMGGLSGGLATNHVYRATVNSNGTLSAWTMDAQNLPLSLDHLGATVANGYIYVLGGERNSPPASAAVYYTHATAGGALAPWVQTTGLPGVFAQGASGHVAASYLNRVYIATGFGGDNAVPDVWSATVNADGTLSNWQPNVNYQRNLVYTAGLIYGRPDCGGNMFLSGGTTNQGQLATDYVAAAALSPPDLIASGWYDTPQLGTARYGHTMVASDDGWLYVIGGTLQGNSPLDNARFGETACAHGGAPRAGDGSFISRAIDLSNSYQVYTLTVNTTLTPTLPVTLTVGFRTSDDDPNFQGVPFNYTVTVPSGISQTTIIPVNTQARYFQYQVTMARADSSITSTPYFNWAKIVYEGSPPVPTNTTVPGPDLIANNISVSSYGGTRPSGDHPIQFNVGIKNIGTNPAPPGHYEADVYMHLPGTPLPSDPSDAFGAFDLNQQLLPGQVLTVTTGATGATPGPLSLYAWANRNRYIPEIDYTNNITGPVSSCIYRHDLQSFSDVHTTEYFFNPVEFLSCHGAVSGYSNGTFLPYNTTTRSQFTKMVVLAVGWPIVTPPGGAYTFADVPTTHPFFATIETAYSHQAVSGYACGGPNEPCDSQHRPYYRPYAIISRGQLAKITVLAKGWALINPTNPTFRDVPTTSPYYVFIETAVAKGIISGYSCGQGCLEFRPNNSGTRGQLSKILYLAVIQP